MSSTEARAGVSVAVLVPCYNEAAAIGTVVQDFRRALPEAQIYVYDNNSTDGSAESAAGAGAIVRKETLQGKGHVVRRMFADVEADVYLLVDGDGTYDAASAPALVQRLVGSHLDMVNGMRSAVGDSAYRTGHRFGNRMLSTMVQRMFGNRVNDLLSGYRVFSRRFVKSFPAMSSGFEIETELTVHALELDMPVDEITTPYHERIQGTASKLRTYRDGFRIVRTILLLTKEQKPLAFFGFFGALLAATSLLLAWPIFVEFAATGLVPRFPTAILSTGLMLSAFLAVTCGLVLDSVARGRRESKRLAYLLHPLIAAPLRKDPNGRRP
jgi:glycosyltransferase involved in cell wall biosynthesis